jgi:glycosyltransferase involved in cell wall biosynthesis
VNRRALVVAPTLPEYDREGGARDLADLVGFLLQDRWDVTYVSLSTRTSPRHAHELRNRGVRVYEGADALPAEVLTGPAPDVVLAAFWHVAESVLPVARATWPSCRVVVSSIDLHFVRNARRIFSAVARGDRSFLLDAFYADEAVREINTYAAADAVVAVSDKEAGLIGDLTGEPSLGWWVPVTVGEERSQVPFEDRAGVLFVGNFQHRPNVDAVVHLCREVVPLLDPALLAQHPVMVVGNAPDDRVLDVVAATPGVRLVGWVPSLTPYLHRSRLCVVPLLHGAGVKGKLVRSLGAGTPAVSTSVGVEGLGLEPGTDVLVADDPVDFARGIETLLTDAPTWQRLADAGHAHVAGVHAPAVAHARLARVLDHVLAHAPKPVALAEQLALSQPRTRYGELAGRLRIVAGRSLDVGRTVLVVSKGDDDLLDLGPHRGEHFPQTPDGQYLGWHPPDGADVVSRLGAQRRRGAHYLVLPATSGWWLDHYPEMRAELDTHYRLVVREEDTCHIWAYPGEPARPDVVVPVQDRPVIAAARSGQKGGRVLVAGVYFADRPNHADDVVGVLGAAVDRDVTQAWAVLHGDAPTERLAAVTSLEVGTRRPKFDILNELIAGHDLSRYDHVLLVDDDIALPLGFVDQLLAWQEAAGFALAQPARTWRSSVDHRIVLQQSGVATRRTRFVEIGPVVSVARAAYGLVLPFDMESPMGWGYENVWAHRIGAAGLTMGIVDAVAVDHVLRPPVANYSWQEADGQRRRYLAANDHLPLEDCMRVIEVGAAWA